MSFSYHPDYRRGNSRPSVEGEKEINRWIWKQVKRVLIALLYLFLAVCWFLGI